MEHRPSAPRHKGDKADHRWVVHRLKEDLPVMNFDSSSPTPEWYVVQGLLASILNKAKENNNTGGGPSFEQLWVEEAQAESPYNIYFDPYYQWYFQSNREKRKSPPHREKRKVRR